VFKNSFAASSIYGDTRIMPEITPYMQMTTIIANSPGVGLNEFMLKRMISPTITSIIPPNTSVVINSG
jgi:hypothetical protein